MKPGAVLLAAGASRRMGSPKQLLAYRGEPLVRRAARVILEAGFHPLCVVVGHEHERVAATLRGLDAAVCVHSQWARGIGSSLRAGVAELERETPEVSSVLVALADQPGVTAVHLKSLEAAFQPGVEVVASAYGDTLGVPAIFHRSLIPGLKALPDGHGAKSLIAAQRRGVVGVPLATPQDIDSPEDYRRVLAADVRGK